LKLAAGPAGLPRLGKSAGVRSILQSGECVVGNPNKNKQPTERKFLMKKLMKLLLLVAGICVVGVSTGKAQPLITVDEFGHGNINSTPLPSFLGPDPTGGLTNWNVLIYNLPFAGVPGDVLMHDGGPTNAVLDVIRFDGQGHLIFYSDNTDGLDAPADTPAPPSPLMPNRVDILEVGSETNNFADYFPTPNQPGFDPSAPHYHFISDIPEPSAAALLVLGAAVLGSRRLRRKLAACLAGLP